MVRAFVRLSEGYVVQFPFNSRTFLSIGLIRIYTKSHISQLGSCIHACVHVFPLRGKHLWKMEIWGNIREIYLWIARTKPTRCPVVRKFKKS